MFESLESAPSGMRRGHGTCIASAMALLAAIAVLAIACEGPAVRAANNDDDQLALSSNAAGLDLAIGRALFERSWVSAPASTKSTDGLGPLYNARSCAACHTDTRRQPMTASGLALPTAIIFKLTGPPSPYGAQLQTAAVQGLAAEGRVQIVYRESAVTLADGAVIHLRQPSYDVFDLGYGALGAATALSPRVPPSLAGVGLLERIDADSILAWADETDANGDGISGRPSRLTDCTGAQPCIGRFGWKAAAAAIDDQNALAFSLDIGMSTPRRPTPWGDCTAQESGCVTAPHGADAARGETEIAPQLIGLLDAFVRAEPAPPPHDPRSPLTATGEAVFAGIGCAACHRPTFAIADGDGASLTIAPYSDLLLHDLGDGLRDARGAAGEWRTAPLWGLSKSDNQPGPKVYLHDGRARTLQEAILWHGGEAERTVAAAKDLTRAEWDALLAFLRSL